MRRFALAICASCLLAVNAWAEGQAGAFKEATEEDASPKCYGYALKFANGALTDNADGTCSVAGGVGDVTAVGDCSSGDCFTGTSGGVLTFSQGESISNATDNSLIFGAVGSTTEALQLGLNSDTQATISSSTGIVSLAFTTMSLILSSDDRALLLGASSDARIEWDTAETNDALKIGVDVGSSAQSGNVMIVADGDINTNFGASVETDPTLRIQSADETQTSDYIKIQHNQTDGLIDVGNGDLVTTSDFEIRDTTPHLRLTPSSGDAFEWYAFSSEAWFTNVTDGTPLLRFNGGTGVYLPNLANCDTIDTNSLGLLSCGSDSGGAGAGDIDAIGDVASGAAFNGTQGTLLTFNDTDGDQTLGYDATNNDFEFSDDLDINDATPHLKWVPASGDAFEAYAFGSEWYLTNVTDGTWFLKARADNNVTLRGASQIAFDPDGDDTNEIVFNSDGSITTAAGNNRLAFASGEYIDGDDGGDGLLCLGGASGAANNESLCLDFETTSNAVTLTSLSSASVFVSNFSYRFLDDVQAQFGTGTDSRMEHDTAETNDTLKLGLTLNTAASSGNFMLVEQADLGTDFGAAQVANPTLRIQSADAAQTSDYVTLAHDQTNAILDVGNGDMVITADTEIQDATPHLRLTPSSGDSFEQYAFGSEYYLTNVTDGVTLLRFDPSYNLSFRGTGTNYKWPTTDGTSGQQLSTNGAGVLSWTNAGAGNGFIIGSGEEGSTGFTSSFYCVPYAGCATGSGADDAWTSPMAGTFSNFYYFMKTAPGAGNDWTCSLVINNTASTNLTFATGNANGQFSDTSGTDTIAAGDEIGFQCLETGTATGTAQVGFSIQFTPS